jgi:beta-lactamase class A
MRGPCIAPKPLRLLAWLATFAAIAFAPAALGDEGERIEVPVPTSPSAARAYLGSLQHSEALQAFLDRTVEAARARDAALGQQKLHIALIDIEPNAAPRYAHVNGDAQVYPASVVKVVYLMAAYSWQEQRRLEIDPEFDRQLTQMIYRSSNLATRQVVARLTETEPGPALPPDEYAEFVERRLAVKRWLSSLGIDDLHTVHPTYNGPDLFGRDVQFLKDASVEGGISRRGSSFVNRQSMTALGTAKLLALLATDLALTPEDSQTVRRRMQRDPTKQPYQHRRIAGGASQLPEMEVYSKSGTWGPIFADAGIVRNGGDRDLVVVAFLEGRPAYRGSFVADLSRESAQHVLLKPNEQAALSPTPAGLGAN